MEKTDIQNLQKAGKIATETIKYAKSFIEPGIPLLEIAEKIEEKIRSLGGKLAFPVNLSINEIAAHYTPAWNDTTLAKGLLKVDLGVHVDGFVADTAFSLDLENSEENKKLIEAAQTALDNASKIANSNSTLSEIGKAIESSITAKGFQPIRNLSGHAIEQYNLHAGLTVPNYDTNQKNKLGFGVFAIEPFATNGLGMVRDGKPSGIYHLENPKPVRDTFAREVLNYIVEEHQALPFSAREIYKKFGSRGLLALRQIESAGLLHHYAQLVEKGNGKVAQAEHTIITLPDKTIITTL